MNVLAKKNRRRACGIQDSNANKLKQVTNIAEMSNDSVVCCLLSQAALSTPSHLEKTHLELNVSCKGCIRRVVLKEVRGIEGIGNVQAIW